MEDVGRLFLPVESGALALPEGPVLLLNARPSPELGRIGAGRLACEQGERPAHDALEKAGFSVSPQVAGGHFAAALVLLARSRAQSLGLLARAHEMVAEGGPVIVSGRKTDGVDGVLAQVRKAHAIDGSLAK
ncbi:MAG TPA: hypothetical protein VFR34_08565, partial [Paracoccaceae bacterium]|nr:hypothetical protein [Paracoccaceae bacterium]